MNCLCQWSRQLQSKREFPPTLRLFHSANFLSQRKRFVFLMQISNGSLSQLLSCWRDRFPATCQHSASTGASFSWNSPRVSLCCWGASPEEPLALTQWIMSPRCLRLRLRPKLEVVWTLRVTAYTRCDGPVMNQQNIACCVSWGRGVCVCVCWGVGDGGGCAIAGAAGRWFSCFPLWRVLKCRSADGTSQARFQTSRRKIGWLY